MCSWMEYYLTSEASGNFPIGATNRDKCVAGAVTGREPTKGSLGVGSAWPFDNGNVARFRLCSVNATDLEPRTRHCGMLQNL